MTKNSEFCYNSVYCGGVSLISLTKHILITYINKNIKYYFIAGNNEESVQDIGDINQSIDNAGASTSTHDAIFNIAENDVKTVQDVSVINQSISDGGVNTSTHDVITNITENDVETIQDVRVINLPIDAGTNTSTQDAISNIIDENVTQDNTQINGNNDIKIYKT